MILMILASRVGDILRWCPTLNSNSKFTRTAGPSKSGAGFRPHVAMVASIVIAHVLPGGNHNTLLTLNISATNGMRYGERNGTVVNHGIHPAV